MRKSKKASTAGQNRGLIKNLVIIHDRPNEIADRAIPCHWEGDMVSGSRNSHIALLVERKTWFLMLVRLNGKDALSVANALLDGVNTLPVQFRCSLTWDRDPEMAKHVTFTEATDMAVYFCDPQAPWQRGSNENTNGLLRQCFPKGTNLREYTQDDLDAIAGKLNGRSRKTLGLGTPADMLYEASVATASPIFCR